MTVKELIEALNQVKNKDRMVLIDTNEDYNPAETLKLLSKERNPVDWVEAILISSE